jgi:hypothetical protein
MISIGYMARPQYVDLRDAVLERKSRMERGQGKRFSEQKIEKIKFLLATTDLTIPEIAERMGCSGGPIVAMNRKYKIRLYNNRRSHWVVNVEGAQHAANSGLAQQE